MRVDARVESQASTPLPLTDARRVLVPLNLAPETIAPPTQGQTARFGGETMGTTWSVQCVLPESLAHVEIDRAIRAVLDEVVAQMSNWRDDSDISRFNRAAAASWVTLPQPCFEVVHTALDVARQSGGAYDPSAGPLVDLWRAS